MENLIQFIPEQLLIVIAATYVMGIFFKNVTFIKDNFIPILLMGFAVLFSVVIGGVSAMSILQGVLCWGTAVGVNQIGKQYLKGEK